MIKKVQTLMKIMSLVSGKEKAYPIKRTKVWYQKQTLWTWSVTWTNGHRGWSVSLLGISVNYVHLIPHPGRGESLKTFDKKKKKTASDQLAFTDPRRGLQKTFHLIFPQVFLFPSTATALSGAHCSLVLRIIVVSVIRHEADLWFQEILKTCSLAEKWQKLSSLLTSK